MITLFETYDRIQADMLKSQLEELGIKAHIYTTDVGGVQPSLAYVTPIKVLVLQEQIEDARRVLSDMGF
ncbi:putative signal transducing protein [Oligoflexus tunisiensis]|uniref:putative signal transducing protein n=1 Tax=Oligoflexus tunisiensis TaxID=708132 RepID=UPI00159F12AC|nr:DUF2007 domain-containing protein [Oligoflexus tunisiensis]